MNTNEHNYDFKSIVLKHVAFFENLKSQCKEEDIIKSSNLYGKKYINLVEEAIEGNINSATNIALLVYNGTYFTKDKATSRTILNDFAIGIDGHADLYSIYCFCRTVLLKERDFDYCNQLIQNLRKLNFLPAFALSGNIQEYGYGVKKNDRKAITYYKFASKNGHLYAKFLLGKLYFKKLNIFYKVYGATIIFRAMLWAFWVHGLGKKPNDERLVY